MKIILTKDQHWANGVWKKKGLIITVDKELGMLKIAEGLAKDTTTNITEAIITKKVHIKKVKEKKIITFDDEENKIETRIKQKGDKE